MSDEEIKLECLKISGMDVNRAREMFRFVTEGRHPSAMTTIRVPAGFVAEKRSDGAVFVPDMGLDGA